MTPHKAIEVLKELKPGDRWTIDLCLDALGGARTYEGWVVTLNTHSPPDRQCWEGSTLDEAMEKVLEDFKV